jgi:hypothetical protein
MRKRERESLLDTSPVSHIILRYISTQPPPGYGFEEKSSTAHNLLGSKNACSRRVLRLTAVSRAGIKRMMKKPPPPPSSSLLFLLIAIA